MDRIGGIDIGGTKIAASLFEGADASPLTTRRSRTPADSARILVETIREHVAWLEKEGGAGLPVGIALPGVIDPRTGRVDAVNVATPDEALGAALTRGCGRAVGPVVNDCTAFAVSAAREAHGAAAPSRGRVLGLVLGTGMSAALCVDGAPDPAHAGNAIEIGHVGVPAAVLAELGLPPLACPCGRTGCFEAYLSGPGLARLAAHGLGAAVPVADLPVAAGGERVLGQWAAIAAEALRTLTITLRPDAIVLGGGVSDMERGAERLAEAFGADPPLDLPRPPIRLSRFGAVAGARGAALLARDAAAAAPRPATAPC